MKFIYRYKYTIIISFFVFLSYVMINNTNNVFGIDEIYANINTYMPSLTIGQSVFLIFQRFFCWNMRLGELVYFTLGRFPKFVGTISNGLTVLLFFNLIFIFTYGKKSKEYFNTPKYYKSLLICYIVSLTLFPAFSEVFMWNAGVYNHIFGVNLSLIGALPFRLLLDDYNIFSKYKWLGKVYFVISFLSGFSVENVTAWMLVFNISIFLYKKINLKDIKSSIKKSSIFFINILLACVGTGIMFLASQIRVVFFDPLPFVNESKRLLLLRVPYLYFFVILLIFILIIINVFKKKLVIKKLKPIEKILLFQALSSVISLLVIMVTSAYFVYRVTILFFTFQLAIIVYLINNLLEDKSIKFSCVIDVIFIIFMSIRLVFFYNDLNDFHNINDKYIRDQYSSGSKVLSCAQYDNKYNYFFSKRLTSFDALFCDSPYYRYLLEDESIEIVATEDKIR